MNSPEKVAVSPFETEPCPRCGGSGTYSRCQTWGTACFECGSPGKTGSGFRLTKRGRVAREFYLSLFPKALASELRPGDVIQHRSYGKRTVVEVRPSSSKVLRDGEFTNEGLVEIETPKITFSGVPKDQEFMLAPTAEQRAEALARALAYQETLTKLGKPRKRLARA